MKAIIIEKFGGPESLVIQEVPTPEPRQGEVVIRIKAFGINHAEMHMRKGEWAEWVPISGIECVGEVASCPGGEFEEGTPVASLMGGLGRTISGSYAEFTRAKVLNVVPLGPAAAQLRWDQLAAIPESYATAWTCLFRNLEIRAGQQLLIRGGTSAFGRSAINLAVNAGVHVTSTTRSENRIAQLKNLGAEDVLIEGPNLSMRAPKKFDAILELIGNSTVLDSLKIVHRGGRVCLAGWLGGLAPIPEFNPLLQMASGVHLSFFGSFVFGSPEFPLSDVPLQEIVTMVARKQFNADPWRVFDFEEIREAHRLMEANEAHGKMVVTVS
ncbi:quinone oxidoreductase [Aspergillus udagawae]|uniref:Quinone oxidoreductase n=1 Tax=Aspergillus udagawae TaxID=91492 RepID=A0ABQ1BDL5_9EURO|nr:quinone oxidoreductase [Aspergillus udagawae]GFF41931.1 quinone oxidoreductase [Aspergillus udagawae]GFF99322.1 quinone oxidoreductase [Aspergillus udagawae]GFG12740.1 quinone oxidoreductase [Aspergillus udagawae]